MSERLPGLTDNEIELLRRLSGVSAKSKSSTPETTSLTDAIRYPVPLDGLNSRALAQPTINRAAYELTRLTGNPVDLVRAKNRTGTFATAECQALEEGLLKIAHERERLRKEAEHRRELEWHQLATCLDKGPLRIGAYQSHAERFLAAAGQRTTEYFPWLDLRLDVEENRVRDEGSRGVIRSHFDAGGYDFILVPRESEPKKHLEVMYTYSFRVVGASARLAELRDADGVIQVERLRGQRLIVAPAGTSSRRRLHDLLQDAGVDIGDGSVKLIEEKSPSSMRIRAEIGQGLAIISDEYNAVGGSARGFPRLGLGHEYNGLPKFHMVEMGLLRQRDTTKPRHQAFEFVVHELVEQEKKRERSAAQD